MTPAGVAAGALLGLLAAAGAFTAYRRRRTIMLGEAHPQRVFPGLRAASLLRSVAVMVGLFMLMTITVADPSPLVDRLFSEATPAERDSVVTAFGEVIAMSVAGAAIVTVMIDATVTFVRPTTLRRVLTSVLAVGLAGCITYGALFVLALMIS